MPKINSNIQNIIFDLGKVIVDVDFDKTVNAFNLLAKRDTSPLYNYETQTALFDALETGKIPPSEFRKSFNEILGTHFSDEKIDTAWNAMLGDTPMDRLKLADSLRPKHKTFVLSNTNVIHIDWINDYLQKEYQIANLDPFFDHVYLSHEIGRRKPNADAFTYILDKHNLVPSETLFIDDKKENTDVAEKLGINVVQLHTTQQLFDLFT